MQRIKELDVFIDACKAMAAQKINSDCFDQKKHRKFLRFRIRLTTISVSRDMGVSELIRQLVHEDIGYFSYNFYHRP